MITKPQTTDKPVVVARLKVGDIIALTSGAVQIVALPDTYQHNTVACFKVATVLDMSGNERLQRFYANFKYQRLNAPSEAG